jgi:hypothetical protein
MMVETNKTRGWAAQAADDLGALVRVGALALGLVTLAGAAVFAVAVGIGWKLSGDLSRGMDYALVALLVLALVVGLGFGLAWMIKAMSLSANAGVQRTIETLATEMQRSNDRAAGKDEAMQRMFEAMVRHRAPAGLPPGNDEPVPPLAPSQPELMEVGRHAYSIERVKRAAFDARIRLRQLDLPPSQGNLMEHVETINGNGFASAVQQWMQAEGWISQAGPGQPWQWRARDVNNLHLPV